MKSKTFTGSLQGCRCTYFKPETMARSMVGSHWRHVPDQTMRLGENANDVFMFGS
ncbi:hypothetical protein ACWGNU_29985 [Paenibacillus lautus]